MLNPMIHQNSPCIICRQKSDTYSLDVLRRIEGYVYQYKITPDEDTKHNFLWGIHSHCKYGITCHYLERTDRTAMHLADKLTPYLVSVAKGDDERAYHDIYNLCRGIFPAVCRDLEKIRGMERRNLKDAL